VKKRTEAARDLFRRCQEPPPSTPQEERRAHTKPGGHSWRSAKALGLTERGVRRRLKEEGTSFQTVREDLLREPAARHLDEGMSIPEISFLLGFSEPSAF
jgi:hypothetical protein